MHWVIDRIISGEPATERLIAAIEASVSRYTMVKKPPFADYLVGMECNDTPIRLDGLDGPVFVSGSTTMELVSLDHGWTPGYIDAPGMDDGIAAWGELMLNHDLYTGPISTIAPPDRPFFIRPVNDGKCFAGAVMTPEGFDDWKAKLLDIKGYTTIPPETPVAIASVKDIAYEWRCLVVDGRFVTGSRYRVGSRITYSPGAPDDVAAFVQARADDWSPRRAFIIDIALTEDGLRVVETNSVSSAGFYAMDMGLYVRAINTLA
jgi:hypothetical protein